MEKDGNNSNEDDEILSYMSPKMRRNESAINFEWELLFEDFDLDLLEIQLHSLYKDVNINFNVKSYKEDLIKSDGYMSIYDCQTIQLSIKSFIKSFSIVLSNHGINVKNFDLDNIEKYSNYQLDIMNSIIYEAKADVLDALKTKDKNIFDRMFTIVGSALSVFSLFRRDAHLTVGKATKKMLYDLMLWEKDIIERALKQLKKDKDKVIMSKKQKKSFFKRK